MNCLEERIVYTSVYLPVLQDTPADEKKRDHCCLKRAAKNMAQVSAVMVLSNHMKDDSECLDENATLLKADFVSSAESNDEKTNKALISTLTLTVVIGFAAVK